MKFVLQKIGAGGLAALAAVALAVGVIGYRLVGPSAEAPSESGKADPLADLERGVDEEPGNAGAWQKLGFAYFELGRFDEAATAYRRATEADPDSAVLWSSLGEALVMASERDPMPGPAREAFRKAAQLDRKDPRARYFLAVEKDLSGDHKGAITDWVALLGETPPGAPWEADLRRTIEQVGKINSIDVASQLAAAETLRPKSVPAMAGIPGPSQEQLAAASRMRPSEQQDMAEGMVERLASRLEREPGNLEGWIMLMRSYQTLGREGDARKALQSALAANPQERAELEAAAKTLGVS
ncbi:tetratricopeptide repeat protein [Croceibacterium sp. LX-88]|uniref:Tetratricopeptide repeat protein n=1 Tax=Croceibacterium selenioxidans TaxID=2838833 RepID=A0ABS5W5I8_9SPHN|nr:tetratricopeptide repeat protein [Croceibacterium selenioxidans]